MRDTVYYNRDFLNKEEGSGMLENKIGISPADEYSGSYFDCQLLIKDCFRQIVLDFDVSSEKEKENALYKIEVLMNELRVIKEHISNYKQKPKLKKKKKGKKNDDA